MKHIQKFLSIALSASMTVTPFGISVFAAEDDGTDEIVLDDESSLESDLSADPDTLSDSELVVLDESMPGDLEESAAGEISSSSNVELSNPIILDPLDESSEAADVIETKTSFKNQCIQIDDDNNGDTLFWTVEDQKLLEGKIDAKIAFKLESYLSEADLLKNEAAEDQESAAAPVFKISFPDGFSIENAVYKNQSLEIRKEAETAQLNEETSASEDEKTGIEVNPDSITLNMEDINTDSMDDLVFDVVIGSKDIQADESDSNTTVTDSDNAVKTESGSTEQELNLNQAAEDEKEQSDKTENAPSEDSSAQDGSKIPSDDDSDKKIENTIELDLSSDSSELKDK